MDEPIIAPPAGDLSTASDETITPLFNTDAAKTYTMPLRLTERYALLADRLRSDLLDLVTPATYHSSADLFELLHLERGRYPSKQEYLVQMLCDDVTIFVREQLITAIKLLFFDRVPENGQYNVKVQIDYPYFRSAAEADDAGNDLEATRYTALQHARDYLNPNQNQLAIVAQWWPVTARERTQNIRRHLYFFDWVASEQYLELATPKAAPPMPFARRPKPTDIIERV